MLTDLSYQAHMMIAVTCTLFSEKQNRINHDVSKHRLIFLNCIAYPNISNHSRN